MPKKKACWALEVRHHDGRRLRLWTGTRKELARPYKEVLEIGLVTPSFLPRELVVLVGYASHFSSLEAEPLWTEPQEVDSPRDLRLADIYEAYVEDVQRGSGLGEGNTWRGYKSKL